MASRRNVSWTPAAPATQARAKAAGAEDQMPAEIAAQVISSHELPGQAVFPESIGLDPVTGDAYVGSLADGALYRLTSAGGTELWGAGGHDGRRSVAGVKVDARGRLWAAGGNDG